MTKYGLTYPLVVDDGSLTARYGITAYPTTIFFDAEGKEVDRLVGAVDPGPVQRLAGQGAVTRAAAADARGARAPA